MERIVLLVIAVSVALGDAGPPAPSVPPGAPLPQRLAILRQELASEQAVDVSGQRAIQFAKRYLQQSGKALTSGETPKADRLCAAAEALLQVAEHEQHLRRGGGPKGPPPPEEIYAHLQRVYFRTEQADFFLTQARDPAAKALPQWARDFYQLALRAYDRKDWLAADENAKCSEDVVRALENLAQAATLPDAPVPPPPPPPRPPSP